jgi:hypothetical protein
MRGPRADPGSSSEILKPHATHHLSRGSVAWNPSDVETSRHTIPDQGVRGVSFQCLDAVIRSGAAPRKERNIVQDPTVSTRR